MTLFAGGKGDASGNKFRFIGDAVDGVVDGVMGTGGGAGEVLGADRIDGVGGDAVED